jgi:magnesium chelatase family protein
LPNLILGLEPTSATRTDADGPRLLERAGARLAWSACAHFRVLRVARTIADLAGDERPNARQIAEAIQYWRALRNE